ncbi:dynamin family protein [Tropicimonas sp. TH_r6]|uniref:dynamin family protein n=1 Tax=Tropicimonas sp. TH_r6 TaxID=3082085 RepID=UPI002954FD04|nr:dynamin family protein [Tropicimonas sp. TH_r6]MDV7141147.1 dynamin family protein [Tropicimonas sp. TH_r6]
MFYNPELKVETPTMPNAPTPAPACAEAKIGRRPRIAIMGEFSAGKSTLTNMLIGSSALPVKVTATQLPPVWLSFGTGAPRGVGLDGKRFSVDFDRIGDIPLARTEFLEVERQASVLELCDIIDFPGISDPNMPAEVWRRVISRADAVIWCSHAVQAWRQSEAAVWDEMPLELQERSFLLLTRMDKLTEERDRRRVLARVRQETEGLFAEVFPISLTRALAAGEDSAAWEASGAEAFMSALLDLVMTMSKQLGQEIPTVPAMTEADNALWEAEEAATRPAEAAQALNPEAIEKDAGESSGGPARVIPRRVSPSGSRRRHLRPEPGEDRLAEIFR